MERAVDLDISIVHRISSMKEELSEYDEKIVRKYIKEIRIFDNRLQVFFKAGIDIDITRE